MEQFSKVPMLKVMWKQLIGSQQEGLHEALKEYTDLQDDNVNVRLTGPALFAGSE